MWSFHDHHTGLSGWGECPACALRFALHLLTNAERHIAELERNQAAFCGCGDACNREGSRCPVCASQSERRIEELEQRMKGTP